MSGEDYVGPDPHGTRMRHASLYVQSEPPMATVFRDTGGPEVRAAETSDPALVERLVDVMDEIDEIIEATNASQPEDDE